MRFLVTAGNTQTPLDQVRCITNIFTGRTGTRIALAAKARGHGVTLLTSQPEVVAELAGERLPQSPDWSVVAYRTFDDLHLEMGRLIPNGSYDAVVHSAAVSDYDLAGVFVPEEAAAFDPGTGQWKDHARLRDASAGKITSQHPELWLRLMPTPKLIDRIRVPWNFQGVLVQFKLEVGVSVQRLLEIAEASRKRAGSDLICANTLEGRHAWAYLGPTAEGYERIERVQLAERLLDEIERLHRSRPS